MAQVNTRKRGNLWEYYFESAGAGGKRGRITESGYKTQKEALAAGNDALSEYNNAGLYFVPSEIGFSDYLDFWMKEDCEVNLGPETIKNYRKKIKNHILPEFERYKLKSITPAVLQAFINRLFNQGFSRTSLANFKGILSKAFLYAVKPLKFIKDSPMVYVKLPSPRATSKVKTRKNPHIFLPQDIRTRIFNRFPEGTSTHIPMMFAFRGGARPSESFAFFWEDIDFVNAKITVNRQVQWDEDNKVWYFNNPKYDSFRTIEIDGEFVALLKREKLRQERARIYYAEKFVRVYENSKRQINTIGDGVEVNPVCIREKGEFITPRNMLHTSSIVHHKMGCPDFDMHSFRKTHGTMLAEKGVPPKYLQYRLGHKNIKVTLQYYVEKTDGMVAQGVAVLNDMFNTDMSILPEVAFFDVDDQSVARFNTVGFDLKEGNFFDSF